MLTLEDVVGLYGHVGKIKIEWHHQRHGRKGEWDPEADFDCDIKVYMQNIISQKDFDITLFHEFLHARDYCIFNLAKSSNPKVEKEAKETYKKNPEIVGYIKDLFLKNPRVEKYLEKLPVK